MKKSLQILEVAALVLFIGLAIYYIAPAFMAPQFEIVNKTPNDVGVTAHWRDENKEIGVIKPSESYRFSVNDEAAMRFMARYPGGNVVRSKEVYFTGGTVVEATITESAIEVRYDFEH